MSGMNNTNTQNDERGLLPYPIIIAAKAGEIEAMNVVIQHYNSYISSLSLKSIQDEAGNMYWGVDQDMKNHLQTKLVDSILTFKI